MLGFSSDKFRKKRVVQNAAKRMSNQRGFSFIEIMIVVIIIGFLASIVGPQIIGRVGKAKQVTAQSQLTNIKLALEQYYLDCGSYPSSEQGLGALVENPGDSSVVNKWTGPYISKAVPKDPWGYDYHYTCPGEHSTEGYDLYSLGSDNQEGGSGENTDITNWSNLDL